MIRHAKLTLTDAQFAALHHLAIDLAPQRGLRRLTIGQLLREAVSVFLEKHGMTPSLAKAVSDVEAQDV